MKTIFAILLMCFTGFAFADGHLEGEEGHHADTGADSDFEMEDDELEADEEKDHEDDEDDEDDGDMGARRG
tara:strand:+ start:620 stop:832 length:213 start_codon:yes stop_codon:yes gene_type:complete